MVVDRASLKRARDSALRLTRSVRNATISLTVTLASRRKVGAPEVEATILDICHRLKTLETQLHQFLSDEIITWIEEALAGNGCLRSINRWGSTSTTWHDAVEALARSFSIVMLCDSETPTSIEEQLLGSTASVQRKTDLPTYFDNLRKRLRQFDFPDEDVDAAIRLEHAIAVEKLRISHNNTTRTDPQDCTQESNSGDPDLGHERAELIPPRALKAAEQYRQVCKAHGVALLSDKEAYSKLANAMEVSGESSDLPALETWARNLREYRQQTGQQKHKPSSGQMRTMASTVRADQIEGQDLPTRTRTSQAVESGS